MIEQEVREELKRGLVPVYAVVTDENVIIPLSLDFWVQKKITGEKKYKSKTKITQELITQAINHKVKSIM